MRRFSTIMVATLLAFSGAAWGAGDKPSFKEADANGDGKVSIQEARKAGIDKEEAKTNDLDDDGKLSKNDWEFVDMDSSGSSSS